MDTNPPVAKVHDGVVIAAWVEPSLRAQLVAIADVNERTLSGEIRLAVRRHLETVMSDRPLVNA